MTRPLITIFITILLAACGVAQSDSKIPDCREVRLDGVDSTGGTINVRDCNKETHQCADQKHTLAVVDAGVKTELKNFHVGDHLDLCVDEKKEIVFLAGVARWDVPELERFFTFAGFAAILLGFAGIVTKGKPQSFIIGEDNRYSNSKFQVALWFWLLLTTYLSAIYLRAIGSHWNLFGSVNIPQNLLMLSGLSALTYGGAKAITTAKVDASQAAGVPDPKPAAAKPNFFADLVTNDGTPPPAAIGGAVLNTSVRSFDFGDFQMLVVTLVAVITYLVLAYHYLGNIELSAISTLPDVDTTLLSAFGLGQGAYLVKKAAGNVATS